MNRPEIINGVDRLVLFDGVCNLCNRNMLFLIARDKHQRLRFCSVQSPAGQEILSWLGQPLDTHESMLFLEGDKLYDKSEAVLHIAACLPWYFKWTALGRILPRKLRDNIYLFVARNRYKLLGRADVCAMPSPELMSRFISSNN